MNVRTVLTICVGFLSAVVSATQIQFRNIEEAADVSDYNFKLGSLALDLGYTGGIVWDDNTNRSGDGSSQEEGVKMGNGLTLALDWPLNPHLRITSGADISYVFFASGEGTDGWIISGGGGGSVNSSLIFDIRVGQYGVVTLGEEFGRSVDAVEISRQKTSGDFSLWTNKLSLQYQNRFSPFIRGAVQTARADTWADDETFNFKDKAEHSVDGLLMWEMNSYTELGPYVRFTDTRFVEDDLNNDATTTELGINVTYQLSETLTSSGKLGFQVMNVNSDNSTRGGTTVKDERDGLTGSLGIAQQVTDLIQQQLQFSFSRPIGVSRTVNFSEDFTTTYSLNWQFTQQWAFSGQLTYLDANESGTFGEHGKTLTTAGGVRRSIGQRADIALGFRRTQKLSNNTTNIDSEYDRNEATLNFNYNF